MNRAAMLTKPVVSGCQPTCFNGFCQHSHVFQHVVDGMIAIRYPIGFPKRLAQPGIAAVCKNDDVFFFKTTGGKCDNFRMNV